MGEARKSSQIVLRIVGAILLCLLTAIIIISIYPPHEHYPSNDICINNLRIIDAAKNEWALAENKTTNDVPTWEDLKPYLERDPERNKPFVKFDPNNNLPICPSGGIYTIGKVGEPTTCSFSNTIPPHVLP
jgi:hypothetical protein